MAGVGDEGVAVEIFGEEVFAQGNGFVLVHPVEAEAGPGFRRHFDDEGRETLAEAIGVGPDPAGRRLLESEGEGVEDLVGAEPEEAVAPRLDVDVEMLFVGVSDAAVGAVGGDDEVVAGPVVEVRARLMFEADIDAEIPGALLQDREQALPADADEAVAGRAYRGAVDVDVDIVPMGEFLADDRARDGVVGHEVLDRLVGEDDAPAERVVGAVALEQVDIVRGVAQLHRNGEIEPGRSPAQARDPHRPVPLVRGGGRAVAMGRQLPSLEGRGWGWVRRRREAFEAARLRCARHPPPAPPFPGGEEGSGAF